MPKTPRKKVLDSTPMPWGEHKGIPMGKVDPNYLLWLFRQNWIRDWPDLHDYLVLNQDALMIEEQDDESANPRGEFTSYEDYLRYGRD